MADKQLQADQIKTFLKWCNFYIGSKGHTGDKIEHLEDLCDGQKLVTLCEVLFEEPINKKIEKNPKLRVQQIANVDAAIKFMQKNSVELKFITAENIVDKNVTLTLGLLWTLINKYSIAGISVENYQAKDALLFWAKRVTHGYKGVEIENFNASWSSGLAFAAIIHHYKPSLINFDSLKPENNIQNLQMVFDIAYKNFNIPNLLDVDMFKRPKPDERSILIYLSQMFYYFSNFQKNLELTAPPLDSKSSNNAINTNSNFLNIEQKSHQNIEEPPPSYSDALNDRIEPSVLPNTLLTNQTDLSSSTTKRKNFCSNCGSKFTDNAKFCSNCGNSIF